MYISNSSNIGMATLLQQNKNCMKALINGGGNIIVGNVVGTTSATQLGTSSGSAVVSTGAATGTSAATTTTVSNIVLPQTQTIVLTNGATGASSVLSYQQYQQWLQQQQATSGTTAGTTTASTTTATRFLLPQEMLSLPIGSIVTTTTNSSGSLAVIGASNTANPTQGAFLVAATGAAATATSHTATNSVSSFQQQFQQQIPLTVGSNSQQNVAKSGTVGLVHQPQAAARISTLMGLQQAPATGSAATATRYFSQFSQQPQSGSGTGAVAVTATAAVANNGGSRTTHVLINRNNNTIIAGNTTQRLHHATILSKPPTSAIALANVTNNGNNRQQPIVVKSQNSHMPAIPQQQQQQSLQQQHKPLQRYGASTLQHIKQQQRQQDQQKVLLCSSSTSTAVKATALLTTISTTTAMINGGGQLPTTTTATVPNKSNTTTNTEQQVAVATVIPDSINPASVKPNAEHDPEPEPEPEIDIVINNVVCSFSVRCHLNLKEIALNGFNVEYRRENGMVTMKLRRPYTTASIWSSGRITCTGATSEEQARIAARRYARCLEKMGFRVRFHNFRVVNVLGTCSMPWAIKIVNFSEKFKKDASYEPELHPGVTYKLRFPKATLKIFSTGSITVTAASVANVQAAIEHIFPLVYEFRKKRSPEEQEQLRLKHAARNEVAEVKESSSSVANDEKEHSSSSVAVDGAAAFKLQRRRPPVPAFNNTKRKRKRLGSDSDNGASEAADGEAIDDPNDIIIYSEFDDPDDLIEGPDDEDNDHLYTEVKKE